MCVCVVDISVPKVFRANQIKAALAKFSHKLRSPACWQGGREGDNFTGEGR